MRGSIRGDDPAVKATAGSTIDRDSHERLIVGSHREGCGNCDATVDARGFVARRDGTRVMV
jgi:hypothetical protein